MPARSLREGRAFSERVFFAQQGIWPSRAKLRVLRGDGRSPVHAEQSSAAHFTRLSCVVAGPPLRFFVKVKTATPIALFSIDESVSIR